jgi:hypothetical protein
MPVRRTIVPPPPLNQREYLFLQREGIHPRWVADCSYFYTLRDCRDWMETTSTCLAVGFRRCPKRHRLMNKRGKCVQCDAALLGWTRRWIRHGFVYLAESPSTSLIKLGSCQDLGERSATLNDHTWAGASDWRMRHSFYTIAAEMFENAVGNRLSKFRCETTYWRYNRETTTREVFECSYQTAKRHFDAEFRASEAHFLLIQSQCRA